MKAIKNRFQVFVLAVLTRVLSMQGQREAQYTQYMYNTSLINLSGENIVIVAANNLSNSIIKSSSNGILLNCGASLVL